MLTQKGRIQLEKYYSRKKRNDLSQVSMNNLVSLTDLSLEDIKQFHKSFSRSRQYHEDNIRRKGIKPVGYSITRLNGPFNEKDKLFITFADREIIDKEFTIQDFTTSLEGFLSIALSKQKEKFDISFWYKTLRVNSWCFESFVFLRTYKELILEPNVVAYGEVI